MNALCPLLPVLILALLYLLQTVQGASYFGDSYCRIDAIQDLSSFQVSLQFKTGRRSGLLLLAAGHRDYLSLELHNGRLQARIDMGSGEKVLASAMGLQLSNLLDHHVSLILKDSKLTMAVDNLYTTLIPIEDADEDLNIDQGVFLGGMRDLEVEYLSTAVPFLRGCMSNVIFESHDFDILASANTVCYDTKETCSSEFEAGDGETTSFISPDSFISFPTWTRPSSGSRSLEMLMKTTIEDALLLFHPGHHTDFIAIGMAGGYLKGIINLGIEIYVLDNGEVKVDDDQWHRVTVQISPNVFQINVDNELVSFPLNGSEKLDLVGNLYLGGIQRKMKDVFQDAYLTRVEEDLTTESFIGCLGEIKVNQKGRSLQDALITKDIHMKCEGEYDYSTYDEELESTTSPPVRVTYINDNTYVRHCFPTDDLPEMFHNISKLLDITPLLVPEGGEAFVDIVNLNPTFNLNSAGVRQSQIIFTLLQNPWYGQIEMNSRHSKKFTLLDVVNKKIKYLHDGNEKYGDQIQLEVIAHGTNLPECLSVARQYLLPVEILPVNDIPQLSAGDISITANGRTRLSPNLIKISDSDNRCDGLKVTVTSDSTSAGYLENAQQPGFGLREFTCRQLKEGNIYFVHMGGEVTGLTLQVSDGDLVSQSSTFKLLITQPQITLVTNTGLAINQDSSASIGIENLAFSATPKTGDVVYNITQPLEFGQLQLISDNGLPKRVTLFHQSDLEQNRLKYIPNLTADHNNIETEFIHFSAQLGQVILPENTFVIQIMPAMVGIAKMVPLEVENGQQKVIKPEQLQAFVRMGQTDSRAVQYVLLKCPAQGVLMMLDKELSEGNTFTQQDILDGFISYSPRVRREADFEDQFQFKVIAKDQYSSEYTFPIKIKADSNAPVLTNERLVVLQGNENIISKENLWVRTSTSTDFVFRITQDPKHGRLFRDSPPGMQRFEGAIRVFSNEDLSLNRLIYKHDGTETSHDQFTFLVFDSRGGNGGQDEGHEALRGVFNIAIQSRNDHVPQRIINKPFNVVRNGQRLLTTDDILYRDDDSDFNDTQLVYARAGILSGNIVSSLDVTQPLYRFTQADLRDRKVLFVHHGADRERFQLQVSDGFHKNTAVLQVQASDPYLRLANNTMMVMDHGSTQTLNTSLLSAETNMDIRSAAEIIYEVTSAPSDGRIIVSGIESSTFTQEDLTKGVVSYEHNDQSLSSKDSFAFSVEAKDLFTEGTFRIKIFKKGHSSEAPIVSNKGIIAYEGEHSVIYQTHLKVEQADILPKEMVYSIKDFPRLGHVVKLNNDSDSTASPMLDYIQSFTQEEINLGTILYVSASLLGRDHFTVDVSNGFATIEDLEVQVDVVPRIIPIQVVNLTVREGGSVALTQDILNITHPFYRSINIEFFMEETPQHGDIKYLDEEDALDTFAWEDVQQGQVYYYHDSSETTEDSFTLIASAFVINRQSASLTVGITVLPVNDEPPRIQRNTGLELLVGEESEITANILSSDDLDTPPEELVYSIEKPSNGIVAFKVSPDDSVDSFTQAQINNGEVLFTHSGSESGGFSFTVTDGEHTSPLYQFTVKARQLTISMEAEGELMVFPGTRQVIGGNILRAITSEDGDEITYSLEKPPRLGRIIKPNQLGQFEEINRFTQTELDAGAVYYEHQMPSEAFWVLKDSVELTLTSPPATVLHHSLPVTVSYYAANRNVSSQLWKNKGVSVVQGQSKVIDNSVLDASNLLASLPEQKRKGQDIVYEVHRFPVHGRLTVGDSDLPREAPHFLQADVARGDLEYYHDDSGASSDSFSFRVHLNPSGLAPRVQPGAIVLEEIFLISIRRRDSNPPELASLDLLLEALQGSMTIISKNYLRTVDQDSTPDEVRFTISKSPANGYLIYTDSGDRINQFSQEDINNGRVAFVSDGSLSDGFMEFTVSDGKHQTDPHTLHIGILAKSLILNKAPEIQIIQGDDETLITEDMLSTSTGGPVEEDVIYKITNVPKYAAVMVDRQPTSAFTQNQIKQGRVSVRFVKSTSPRDSVAFVARSRAANVSSVLNITVKPLAKVAQSPLLPRGATVLVDRKLLDATPLANKTRTSPTFSIIQQPQGARFIKRGGSDDGQPVRSFTQRDLDEGRVALEISNATGGQSQDEARFLLKAHGVPPAECVLPFQVVPYDPSKVYGATLLKVPQVSISDKGQSEPRWRGDGDVASGSTAATPVVSRRNTLWAILIPILVILLLILLAALLAYYLVRRNKTGKHNVQTVPAKPKNGDVSQETFRKTDPANNIPMSSMDSKGADPELIQHCRTTNPALKKNQYWV
ncbi:chondroitin sulfate proteoglycan 4 [Pimephales promelas]|uniref:chondroitin sulfate proteoglycan 4 n=1 Tax=Pimephales promelas TaxID=90988 RepID=UPI001955CF46|nr:chondroitin sulfate proteoglycan 4 [Pimephales promelas]KAG1952423.1 chondroitin sulfate proteoglycan 4-like [Pimephales promelas]